MIIVPFLLGFGLMVVGFVMMASQVVDCSYERNGLGGWVAFAGLALIVATVFDAFLAGG